LLQKPASFLATEDQGIVKVFVTRRNNYCFGGGWHSSMLLEGAAGEVAGFEAEWMEELCGKSDCLMLSSAPVDMDDVEEIQKKMAS
jgi:hypothetical protein